MLSVVLDESLNFYLVLYFWIVEFLCFVARGSHWQLRIRLCWLDAASPCLLSLICSACCLVLLLRQILKHFGEYLLVDWHGEFLLPYIWQLSWHHVSCARRLSLPDLVRFSLVRLMEPYWALMLIYECNLLIKSRFVFHVPLWKQKVHIFLGIISWFP